MIISTISRYNILEKFHEINLRCTFHNMLVATSFRSDRRYKVHSFVQHITNGEVESIQLGELPV